MTSELTYNQVEEEYRQLKHDLDCFNADRNEVELIRSRYYDKIDSALRDYLGQMIEGRVRKERSEQKWKNR